MKLIILLLTWIACSSASAQAADQTKQEIAQLMNYLATSECRFNRNGKWYDAKRAAEHLSRKYEYLLKRNLAPNAEAFIERAASASTASGKPYLVQCGDEPEVNSAAWFSAALEKLRSKP